MVSEILTNHKIYNLSVPDSNTEVSQALTDGVFVVTAKCRDPNVDIKLTLAQGESGTTYVTVFGGSEWFTKGKIRGTSKTLYIQSPKAGVVIEIEEWS